MGGIIAISFIYCVEKGVRIMGFMKRSAKGIAATLSNLIIIISMVFSSTLVMVKRIR